MRFTRQISSSGKRKKYRISEWLGTLSILRDRSVKESLMYLYNNVFKNFHIQELMTYIYRILMFSPRMIQRYDYWLAGRWSFWFKRIPFIWMCIYLMSFCLAQVLGGWSPFLLAFFLITGFAFSWGNFKAVYRRYVPQGLKWIQFFTYKKRTRTRKDLIETSFRTKYFLKKTQNKFQLKSVFPKRRWTFGPTNFFYPFQFYPPQPLNWFSQSSWKLFTNEKFTLYHHSSYYLNSLVVDPMARTEDEQLKLKNYITKTKKMPFYRKEFQLMGLIANVGKLNIEKIYSTENLFDSRLQKQVVVACYALCWQDQLKNPKLPIGVKTHFGINTPFGVKTPVLALGPWFIDRVAKKPWYVLLENQVFAEAFDRGYRIRSDIDKLRISDIRKSAIIAFGHPQRAWAKKDPSLLSIFISKLIERILRRIRRKFIVYFYKKFLGYFKRKLKRYFNFFYRQWLLNPYRIWLISDILRMHWLRKEYYYWIFPQILQMHWELREYYKWNIQYYATLEYETQYFSKPIRNKIFLIVDNYGKRYLTKKDLMYTNMIINYWKKIDKWIHELIQTWYNIAIAYLTDRYWVFFTKILPKNLIYKRVLPWLKHFIFILFAAFSKDVWRLLPVICREISHYIKFFFNYSLNLLKYTNQSNSFKIINKSWKTKNVDKQGYLSLFSKPSRSTSTIVRKWFEFYERFNTKTRHTILSNFRSNTIIHEQTLAAQAEKTNLTRVWANTSLDYSLLSALKYSNIKPMSQIFRHYTSSDLVAYFIRRNFVAELENFNIIKQQYSNTNISIHGAFRFDYSLRFPTLLPYERYRRRFVSYSAIREFWYNIFDIFLIMGGSKPKLVLKRDAYLKRYLNLFWSEQINQKTRNNFGFFWYYIRRFKRFTFSFKIVVHKKQHYLYHKANIDILINTENLNLFVRNVILIRTRENTIGNLTVNAKKNIILGIPKYKRNKQIHLKKTIQNILYFKDLSLMYQSKDNYSQHKSSYLIYLQCQYLVHHIFMINCIYTVDFYHNSPTILATSTQFNSSDCIYLSYKADPFYKFNI